MSLVKCRYNPNHQMKSSRLLIHEDKCPDRGSKILRACPYNPVHKVTPFNFEAHKRECPQRPIVDGNTERELKEYLRLKSEMSFNTTKITSNARTTISNEENLTQSKVTVKQPNTHRLEDNERNYYAPEKKIIGFTSKNDKQKEKYEKKKRQKEMMHLIENANFEESGILDNVYNDVNIRRRNKLHNMDNFDEMNDVELMNSIEIQSHDFQLNESMFRQVNEFLNNTKELEIDEDCYENINAYDPNESDLHIDRRNKNNIYNNFDLNKKEEEFSIILSSSMSKIN